MASKSKKQIKDEVTSKLDISLDKLYLIWQEIGIDETQVGNRASTVSMHLCNLMKEMVSEEEQLRDQMALNIQHYVDDLSQLCLELSLPLPKVLENVSMVQREKELRCRLETLNREKQERMRTLKKLHEEDQRLCEMLCSAPYYIPSGVVPSRHQLQELETHVKSLEAEREKRHGEFVCIKKRIVDLCNEMDHDPETSFERDLICEDDEMFQLSTDNMRSLATLLQELEKKNRELHQTVQDLWTRVRALWERLGIPQSERAEFESKHPGHKNSVAASLREEILRCEQLKYDNLQHFVEGMRRELVDWWKRCYFSKEQRDTFLPYLEENYTEELLEVHEQELEKMRSYFEMHKDILELIAKRERLWEEMLEFEKKASDPNRFFNDRGGKLLREEKARKKLMKELPRIEEDTKEKIDAWEKQNEKKFLIEGVLFAEYVEKQWNSFHEQKEQEKQARLKSKAKQMEEEMIFGSKPTSNTPAKRRIVNTPGRTPLKARKADSSVSVQVQVKLKLNETPRTPASVSRIQHSSVFPSPYSRVTLSSKTPNMNHTMRRRSLRRARKVLQESIQRGKVGATAKNDQHVNAGQGDLFSQTTKGLSQTARPNCRSSVAPSIGCSPLKRW
ncbi:protein regulator of cytokinesis 1-like isoform X3 [Pomacea canaliculata]|uniref:protein regulator of cytokinesis 1-like isoform X3 n=1 Tax=Pomacea canaliculata TaxID=400727 RepID=UPI000D73F183|nr:protein regulator of cytokinesis 1-like isoform X3 [Pomacea canaliculata]